MPIPSFRGACALATILPLCALPQTALAETPFDPVTIATLIDTAPEVSLRPALRPAGVEARAAVPAAEQAGFRRWVAGFRGRALAQGIHANVFDTAFDGATYQADVIKRDGNQAEFTKTIWQYLGSAVSDKRVQNGTAKLAEHSDLLNRIEERYGVEKEVVVAVWGLESAYGSFRGDHAIVPALATLAYDGRRGRFFESQLIAALKILQNGDTTVENLTGSWAGAMGHTQFIPTSYEALAVDFTGDNRRDIWSDDPADALASTANYLAKSGWTKGQPWGVEVQLPDDFDYALASRKIRKTPADWAALGVMDMAGAPVPDHGQASLLLPAGAHGAAFLFFSNFRAIERYNAADAYVIGVGHLSDRLAGKPPIQAAWPSDARALTRAERKELQRRLGAAGFNAGGVDGRIGPRTMGALRAYQRSVGLVPDGYASLSLLERLR